MTSGFTWSLPRQGETAANGEDALKALLDRDPGDWSGILDRRFATLNDVLFARKPAVIYPAARMGRQAAQRLRAMRVQIIGFGDSDPTLSGATIDGLPVFSPAEIAAQHRHDPILVASTLFDSVIVEDLRARGCSAVIPVGYLNLRLPEVFSAREYQGSWTAVTDKVNRPAIEAAFSLLGDADSRRVFLGKLAFYLSLDKDHLDKIKSEATIYFDPNIYALGAAEVVVDGGAYTGDTLTSFRDRSGDRFHSYYAFEPDEANFAVLSDISATDSKRVVAIQAGLAGDSAKARLLSTSAMDSRVLNEDEPGGAQIDMVRLDDYFDGRPSPTLIKMDIEGAEAAALSGAARLLRESAPVLAVSAYHFPTDLWTIPLLIKRLMPNGRLYLRHYTREVDDTVCYALPPDRVLS